MAYNPATDFLALWRNIAGQVSKVEMPGLDYVMLALARAGLFTLVSSATAPVANQSTTAWLDTQTPSWAGEGTLNLWNPVTSAYVAATPALFVTMLETAAGQNGVSWWTAAGGPPANTVGNNGDFAVRTDEPNGIYGPKTAGVWPANPIPGTADVLTSTALDNTFGATEGQIIYRGASVWEALPIGAADTLLASIGGLPAWEGLSALLDIVLGTVQGSIPYRDAGLWEALAPGIAGYVFTTNGAGADPTWQPAPSTFPSGTVMLFQQTAAPTGWTKLTSLNDCGLRVTSGAVGFTSGSSFSSVFAQTAVGNTTITQATMPSHTHTTNAVTGTPTYGAGTGAIDVLNSLSASVGSTGSDGAHTHSVNLALAYVDVILASKN